MLSLRLILHRWSRDRTGQSPLDRCRWILSTDIMRKTSDELGDLTWIVSKFSSWNWCLSLSLKKRYKQISLLDTNSSTFFKDHSLSKRVNSSLSAWAERSWLRKEFLILSIRTSMSFEDRMFISLASLCISAFDFTLFTLQVHLATLAWWLSSSPSSPIIRNEYTGRCCVYFQHTSGALLITLMHFLKDSYPLRDLRPILPSDKSWGLKSIQDMSEVDTIIDCMHCLQTYSWNDPNSQDLKNSSKTESPAGPISKEDQTYPWERWKMKMRWISIQVSRLQWSLGFQFLGRSHRSTRRCCVATLQDPVDPSNARRTKRGKIIQRLHSLASFLIAAIRCCSPVAKLSLIFQSMPL